MNDYRDNELSIICGIEGQLPSTISDDGDFVTFAPVQSEDRMGKPVTMELCMTWEPDSARWESFYSIAA